MSKKYVRKNIGKRLRFQVFHRDKFACQYCGARGGDVILHVDHIVPVSKGGTNDINNLITACYDCNLGKFNRQLTDPVAPRQEPPPPEPKVIVKYVTQYVPKQQAADPEAYIDKDDLLHAKERGKEWQELHEYYEHDPYYWCSDMTGAAHFADLFPEILPPRTRPSDDWDWFVISLLTGIDPMERWALERRTGIWAGGVGDGVRSFAHIGAELSITPERAKVLFEHAVQAVRRRLAQRIAEDGWPLAVPSKPVRRLWFRCVCEHCGITFKGDDPETECCESCDDTRCQECRAIGLELNDDHLCEACVEYLAELEEEA